MPNPRPDWPAWGRALVAFLFIVVTFTLVTLILALAPTADGQTLTPGVGYPVNEDTVVCTEDRNSRNRRCVKIDLTARPYGPDGTATAQDQDAYSRRYAGGPDAYPGTRQPIGLWADQQALNIAALESWFAEQPESHRSAWTGTPTREEWVDLAHREGRRGSAFYWRHWFSKLPGRSVEDAHIVDESTWRGHAWRFEPGGGLNHTLGIQRVLDSQGYPEWYDVRWLPGVTPEPPPPPEPPPACTPYQGSECQKRCQAGADRGWPWTREWCLAPERPDGPGQIGRVCRDVCREEPTEPPAPEPGPGPLPPACVSGSKVVVSVLSTGRLQAVIYNPETGECEVLP